VTWFKVDDSFHSHPKVLAASPAALGLWVVAGSWCGANLTEGHIPAHVLPRLMPKAERLARELVRVGLWKQTETGFVFHDWTDFNPTREEAVAAKERQSSGGAIGNHRRWHEAKGKVDPKCRYCQKNPRSPDRVPDRSPDGGTDSVPNRPSRPDPTRPISDTPPPSAAPPRGGRDTDEPKRAPKRQREGTRLPNPFPVTDEMAAWAREKAPLCGPEDHEAFCDYWRSVPGAKGRKLDWVATWRNWMRKEQAARARTRPGPAQAPRRSTADERIEQAQALKAELGLTPNGTPPIRLIRGELA